MYVFHSFCLWLIQMILGIFLGIGILTYLQNLQKTTLKLPQWKKEMWGVKVYLSNNTIHTICWDVLIFILILITD